MVVSQRFRSLGAADLYGTDFVGQNYGAVYTGKAIASLLAGPLASAVAEKFSWSGVIQTMAVASAVDAALALALRRLLVVREPRKIMSGGDADGGVETARRRCAAA